MSHDKEAFAQEAMRAGRVGKLVGDYVRIVHISQFAKVLCGDLTKVKDAVDPFTGCFISPIPITLTYLRFGLKAASFFASGEEEEGFEFIQMGSHRLANAFRFVCGENSRLKQQYEKERMGWDLYYETLSAMESALSQRRHFSLELHKKAQGIVSRCLLPPRNRGGGFQGEDARAKEPKYQ
jgi:hypothetical protein